MHTYMYMHVNVHVYTCLYMCPINSPPKLVNYFSHNLTRYNITKIGKTVREVV